MALPFYSIRISAGKPPVLAEGLLLFSAIPRAEFRDSTSIRQRFLPSKSFPNIYSPVILRFHDISCEVLVPVVLRCLVMAINIVLFGSRLFRPATLLHLTHGSTSHSRLNHLSSSFSLYSLTGQVQEWLRCQMLVEFFSGWRLEEIALSIVGESLLIEKLFQSGVWRQSVRLRCTWLSDSGLWK
jgi:hypothetical protein